MEKITLKKQDITKLIQILREQDEVEEPNDEIYIDSEELNRLLPAIDYNLNALSKLRKFKDKKIVINGDLKLRGKPVKSLGPIIRINGNLDMVDTDIASIEGVQIAGRVTDWGSEMAKIKERRRVAGELAQAQSRREDDEWSLENADEEGLCAIAVFQFLQEEEPNEVQSEEDVDRLRQLKERRGNIYYDQEQGNDSEELQNELDSVDAEIEEIELKIDVYALIPSRYKFYGKMYSFDILNSGGLYGNTYAASTESEAERAALQYAEEYIDENGVRVFNENFWTNHLDEESILDYFRDFYDDDIRNNHEAYFDDDDFELTNEQEARKEQLENYIEEMEQLKSDTEDEQSDLEDSDSEEYENLEFNIKEIESNIETAQNELDEIEPDKIPTEDMIERKVDDMLDDVKYDYSAKLDEFGLDVENFIDKDALAQAFVDSDGIGIMNGYNNTYETVYVNNETYVVMRIN